MKFPHLRKQEERSIFDDPEVKREILEREIEAYRETARACLRIFGATARLLNNEELLSLTGLSRQEVEEIMNFFRRKYRELLEEIENKTRELEEGEH